MRTEDDLRAALLTLERHAPAAERVLPGRRQERRRPERRRWLTRGLLAGSGAIAVGVVAAILVTLVAPRTPVVHSRLAVGQAMDTSLRTAILGAVSSAAGDVMYAKLSDDDGPGQSGLAQESWWYPWLAKPGQQVRQRILTMGQPGGTSWDDEAQTYTLPRTGVPSYALTTDVDYGSRTWSVGNESTTLMNPENLYDIRDYITKYGWVVAGYPELNGQRALELKVIRSLGGTGTGTFVLWVSARTYLPMRAQATVGNLSMLVVTTYQFLPPTRANLAQLQPTVPAGFRRVPVPSCHCTNIPQG
jgi:hypothetical protein